MFICKIKERDISRSFFYNFSCFCSITKVIELNKEAIEKPKITAPIISVIQCTPERIRRVMLAINNSSKIKVKVFLNRFLWMYFLDKTIVVNNKTVDKNQQFIF